jgi:hypothetical protein
MKMENHRFATEVPQPADCQRHFEDHGTELEILCDCWEDGYPIGKIIIGSKGIQIKLSDSEQDFPVTVVRTIVKTS